MVVFKCNTLGEAWILSMKTIMEQGEDIADEGTKLKEIRNLYMTINSIEENDPIIIKYADKDRIKLMEEKYATCGLVGDYKIDYGSYIYNNNGINQIDWLIHRLKSKPETKSATITLHKPGEKQLACLSMLDFKYRNNLLEMTVIYRSQNAFWSQPGNILALRKIQKDIATTLNYKMGKVELIVISSHIYENDYKKAKAILNDIQKI